MLAEDAHVEGRLIDRDHRLVQAGQAPTAISAVRTDVSTVKTTSAGSSTNWPMNARFTNHEE